MIGQQILRYKIIKKLGEGGMGEVYLAEDSELHRKVALKFLPAHFSKDPAVNTRFKHEAKAAAALNHSNIITIYDIGEFEGKPFIAMEYLPGKSLKDLLEKDELSLDRITDIASQICSGLSEAHGQGITHRDIKPDNILVDSKGKIKIADFGLAKAHGQTKVTDTGSTLGTISYMSPEQLRGSAVDQRADIWSLGVMLYEMITGRLPFGGDYKEAISYSILHDTPEPLARYKGGVSEGWQRITDKSLDKDMETRYQNVDDLLADIKREKKSSSVITPVSIREKRPLKLAIVTTSLLIMLFIATIIIVHVIDQKTTSELSLIHKQITFNGNASYPAISPDGQFIAYIIDNEKLMIQDLITSQTVEIYRAFGVGLPNWSPDGSEIMFVRREAGGLPKIMIIPRLGGNARTLGIGAFNCWTLNGSWVASGIGDIKEINLINKTNQEIKTIPLKGFKWLLGLDWSEKTGNFLINAGNEDNTSSLWFLNPVDSTLDKLIDESNHILYARWSHEGNAIYCLRQIDNTTELLKLILDSNQDIDSDKTTILLSGLEVGEYFSISSDGKRMAYNREKQYANLWIRDLKKRDNDGESNSKKLTKGTLFNQEPSFSPDGKWIIYSSGLSPKTNVYKLSSIGGEPIQLTFNAASNRHPVWTHDGKRIAYGSDEGGSPKVWTMNGDGSKPRKYGNTELSNNFDLIWTPDDQIFYQRPNLRNYHFLDPFSESERPFLKNDSLGYMLDAKFSPDGKKLAVHWNRVEYGYILEPPSETPTPRRGPHVPGLWIINLLDSSQIYSHERWGVPIEWSEDGSILYCINFINNSVFEISAAGGEPTTLFKLEGDCQGIDIHTQSGKIAFSIEEKNSDIWLVENFDPEIQ